jgi:FtsP/CotA-like multicopper oxidase with cupredoxin domain
VQQADAPRRIRVVVREKQNMYGDRPGFAFVAGGSPEERDPAAMPSPAPPLILERGRPVAITVVNRATEHTSIHWHGIELESYPDGVPGWSGTGPTVLPSIKPGDSITVRYTPPRAGTFMYHSHMHEDAQTTGGAYGPNIVVEPGQKFDPEVDKVLFFGTAGMTPNVVFGPYPEFVLNGERQPGAMMLRAGTRYRFRLFNLAGDVPTVVSINAGDKPIDWTFVAKDGYTLPPSQKRQQPAQLKFEPGEIYEFEYTPVAGELTLSFGPPAPPPNAPPLPPIFAPPPPTIKVPIRVR